MKKYNLNRLLRILCLRAVTHVPMGNSTRALLTKMGGVKIIDRKHVFIGEGCIFDSLYPERIKIGKHVHITMRCIILTHELDTNKNAIRWKPGGRDVIINDHTFIGANTVICKGVTIGSNVIVGASSVVTKDIPDNEIWGGNPARFIRKREL